MSAKIHERKTKRPYEQDVGRNAEVVNAYTYALKERDWFTNLAMNMAEIRAGRDVKELDSIHKGKPGLIIGAGPSVDNYTQLEIVRRSGFKGVILACDKILKPCFQDGVIPNYVVSTDSDIGIAQFFAGIGRLDRTLPYPQAIVNGITVHPYTLAALRDADLEPFYFVTFLDKPDAKVSLTRALHIMTGKAMLPSLGNVGAMCWCLAAWMGLGPIGIIGLDYGYPVDTPIEDTIYYNAYKGLVGENRIKQCYRVVMNPESKARVRVDLNWDAYAFIFRSYAKIASFTTYNLSPESALFGPGIKYMPLKEFLKKFSGGKDVSS